VLVVPLVWSALTGTGTGATLDVLGAALVGLTAAGLVLLVQSPSTGLTVTVAGLGLLVLGVPAVALHVRRRPHGFLPRTVIGNATVVRSAIAAGAVPSAWFGLLIAVPAVLVGHGWEPWQVGLLLVPPAALSLVVPRHAGRLLDRVGPVRTLAIGAAMAGLALLLAVLGTALVAPVLFMLATGLVTTAFCLGQPALTASVSTAVVADVRGVALGVSTLIFMVGASLGSAAVGGIGAVVGISRALAFLALLPVVALVVLFPLLERSPSMTDLDPEAAGG
jgi:hypothetical protein